LLPQEVEQLVGDISDRKSFCDILQSSDVDLVFHLAGDSQVRQDAPQETFEANTLGTLNILDAVRQHSSNSLVIVLSTAALSVKDSAATGSTYVVSKECAERISLHYRDSYSLDVIVVRATNIYGPGDRNGNRLVPSIFHGALEDPELSLRGHPDSELNLLYVRDAVDALMQMASHRDAFLNLGSPSLLCAQNAVKVSTIVDFIADAIGRPIRLNPAARERPRHTEARTLAPSAALLESGWMPRVALAEGIEMTAEDSWLHSPHR